VRDIGAEVAHSIREYFDEPRNLKAIKRLEKELHIEKTRVAEGRGPFRDKTFVLTGTLETMTREEAEQKILEGGGRVSGSVSRKTDFVVVGADPGSKARKATELGVKTLDEKEFVAMSG
jgi:DNA ligase (NAD+)